MNEGGAVAEGEGSGQWPRDIHSLLNFGDEMRSTTDEDDIVLTTKKLFNLPTKKVVKHSANDTATSSLQLLEECEDLVQITESFIDEIETTDTTVTTTTSSTTSIYDVLWPKVCPSSDD